jgi:ABC-type multidrug transport system ATPase subunit
LNVYATNIFGVKKTRLIKDIKFEVPTGAITTFIGHNGAGKTTIIKSLLGLRKVNSGEVTINGINFNDIKCRAHVGYIPEKGNISNITSRCFLRQIAAFAKISEQNADIKMERLTGEFKLPKDRLDIPMSNLSSGQNKVITIVQAFMGLPYLIIADEPTDNLDPENRDLFYEFLKRRHEENADLSFFVITHNLDEIEKCTDYIVVIDHGSIKYEGTYNKTPGLREKYKLYRDSNFKDGYNFNTNIKDRYSNMLKQRIIDQSEYDILVKNSVKHK